MEAKEITIIDVIVAEIKAYAVRNPQSDMTKFDMFRCWLVSHLSFIENHKGYPKYYREIVKKCNEQERWNLINSFTDKQITNIIAEENKATEIINSDDTISLALIGGII